MRGLKLLRMTGERAKAPQDDRRDDVKPFCPGESAGLLFLEEE